MSLVLYMIYYRFFLVKLNLIAGFTRQKEIPRLKLKIKLDSLTVFHITHANMNFSSFFSMHRKLNISPYPLRAVLLLKGRHVRYLTDPLHKEKIELFIEDCTGPLP